VVGGDGGEVPQTLAALGGQLDGACQAAASDVAVLGTPTGASALEAAFTAAFGQLAPATRARHLSALRSALAWWAEADWVTADPTAGWARPKVPVDNTRALTRAQVAAIWKLDVPLLDKALWRMLHETAARAEEILGLDVPDLDLPGKRGASSPRAARPTGSAGRPAPRCCCPGCWPGGARARCS
jgi:integrase